MDIRVDTLQSMTNIPECMPHITDPTNNNAGWVSTMFIKIIYFQVGWPEGSAAYQHKAILVLKK